MQVILLEQLFVLEPLHSEYCEISNSQALRLLCWSDEIPHRRESREWHLSTAAAGAIG